MKVYLATNTKNGKRYVGLTTGPIATRWYMHCWLAASDADYALHRAIRKHGADAFTVEEIDSAGSEQELRNKERHHIARLGTHTSTGRGYNMTMGGEGVLGYEFPEEIRALMSLAAVKRFAAGSERDKQRQRQKRYWTAEQRVLQSAKIKLAHQKAPSLAKVHAELMRALSDPAVMARKARVLWSDPESRERFLKSTHAYWANPANREKRGAEVRRRYTEQATYAENVSEGKKRHFREHPETAQRHGEFMRRRALDPKVKQSLSDQLRRAYDRDPTLVNRMAAGRRRFYNSNPDARSRVADTSRVKAAERKAMRERLLDLASDYQRLTGRPFAVPSRAEGGWKTETMVALVGQLEAELDRLRSSPLTAQAPSPAPGDATPAITAPPLDRIGGRRIR